MSPVSRGDRGQATVELALVLPLVVMVLAGLLQVALLITTQVALEHAAREGARAAAVAPDRAGAAEAAARRSIGDRAIEVSTSTDGRFVRVVVSAHVPLLSLLPGLDARRLRADVVMRCEDLGWAPPPTGVLRP